MTPTAVYTCAPTSNGVGRETVVFDNLEIALAMIAGTETRRVPLTGDGAHAIAWTAPGLRQVKSHEQIIALGRAAHTLLADFQKRTLIASELDVAGDPSNSPEIADDIRRLIWSCVNTSKLVALGDGRGAPSRCFRSATGASTACLLSAWHRLSGPGQRTAC